MKTGVKMMSRGLWLLLCLRVAALGQAPARVERLAEMMEDPSQQAEVIRLLRSEPDGGRAAVLGWIAHPPKGRATIPFAWGLVVAVGELQISEGIPYLLDHLAMRRMGDIKMFDTFGRSDAARFPAVYALLRFGRPGFEALLKSREGPLAHEQWVMVIHAIGLFQQPESEAILRRAVLEAEEEKGVAQTSLERLQAQRERYGEKEAGRLAQRPACLGFRRSKCGDGGEGFRGRGGAEISLSVDDCPCLWSARCSG